jgi:hypothetical protein
VILPLLLLWCHFWDEKSPADWTIEEVQRMLLESPWATVSHAALSPPLPIHVASAEPMIEAEARERQAGRRQGAPGPSFDEYQELVRSGRYIALAVYMPDDRAISDLEESRSLERDSLLHIGKRAYKLYTYFPPSPSDPYLRYLFPRDVKPGDKMLSFDIYVPGAGTPQRHPMFSLKEMMYKGKPSY